MATERYTVIVSGERFVFTRDQLESEPGNYFATYFLGDFREAANGIREMELEKEPLLFKLIQAHLRGYRVIPIQDRYVPDYMSKTEALDNLKRDAEFFGLSRLVSLIDEIERPDAEDEGNGTPGEKIYRLWGHRLGEDTLKNPDGSKRTLVLTSEAFVAMLNDKNLFRNTTPHNCEICWKASRGWQVEAWFDHILKRMHNVVESKTV